MKTISGKDYVPGLILCVYLLNELYIACIKQVLRLLSWFPG